MPKEAIIKQIGIQSVLNKEQPDDDVKGSSSYEKNQFENLNKASNQLTTKKSIENDYSNRLPKSDKFFKPKLIAGNDYNNENKNEFQIADSFTDDNNNYKRSTSLFASNVMKLNICQIVTDAKYEKQTNLINIKNQQAASLPTSPRKKIKLKFENQINSNEAKISNSILLAQLKARRYELNSSDRYLSKNIKNDYSKQKHLNKQLTSNQQKFLSISSNHNPTDELPIRAHSFKHIKHQFHPNYAGHHHCKQKTLLSSCQSNSVGSQLNLMLKQSTSDQLHNLSKTSKHHRSHKKSTSKQTHSCRHSRHQHHCRNQIPETSFLYHNAKLENHYKKVIHSKSINDLFQFVPPTYKTNCSLRHFSLTLDPQRHICSNFCCDLDSSKQQQLFLEESSNHHCKSASTSPKVSKSVSPYDQCATQNFIYPSVDRCKSYCCSHSFISRKSSPNQTSSNLEIKEQNKKHLNLLHPNLIKSNSVKYSHLSKKNCLVCCDDQKQTFCTCYKRKTSLNNVFISSNQDLAENFLSCSSILPISPIALTTVTTDNQNLNLNQAKLDEKKNSLNQILECKPNFANQLLAFNKIHHLDHSFYHPIFLPSLLNVPSFEITDTQTRNLILIPEIDKQNLQLKNQIENKLNASAQKPSTLSVPDLSSLTKQNLEHNFNHNSNDLKTEEKNDQVTPYSLLLQQQQLYKQYQQQLELELAIARSKHVLSNALANLYRNKPPPNYFNRLFYSSSCTVNELNKPKLIDYLLDANNSKDNLNKHSDSGLLFSCVTPSVATLTTTNVTTPIKTIAQTTITITSESSDNFKHKNPNSVMLLSNSINKPISSTKVIKSKQTQNKKMDFNMENPIIETNLNLKLNSTASKLAATSSTKYPLLQSIEIMKNQSLNYPTPNLTKIETSNQCETNNSSLNTKTCRNPMLTLLRQKQPILSTSLIQDELLKDDKLFENKFFTFSNTSTSNENKIETKPETSLSIDNLLDSSLNEVKTVTEQEPILNNYIVSSDGLPPSKGRLLLIRMLARKELKPAAAFSSDKKIGLNPNKQKLSSSLEIEEEQNKKEIDEIDDKLELLQTIPYKNRFQSNLHSNASLTSHERNLNSLKSNLRENSCKEITNDEHNLSNSKLAQSESTLSKLRKKAASSFVVRFAKLTQYASVDNGNNLNNINLNKTSASTISGALFGLGAKSSNVEKITNSSSSKQRAFARSKLSSSNSISYLNNNVTNRPRYSITIENAPKMTEVRKILNPEEERRDLETLCKSYWDSFIDCQCIECTFNNAAKFITAFILFLTIAMVINTITISKGRNSNIIKIQNRPDIFHQLNHPAQIDYRMQQNNNRLIDQTLFEKRLNYRHQNLLANLQTVKTKKLIQQLTKSASDKRKS